MIYSEPAPLRCPECGYSPVEDGVPQDEELDCFDAIGAEFDELFCQQCNCRFSTTTGRSVTEKPEESK